MLEKNRKRAWRRVQETRVQTKRFHYYKDWSWSYSDDWSMRNKRNHSIADDPERYAYLKTMIEVCSVSPTFATLLAP